MPVLRRVPQLPMYFIYSLLLGLGFLILLPRFLIDATRHGKYMAGLRDRRGLLPLIQSDGRPVIWIHCVSVGETQAARPLVNAIRTQFPNHSIAISTTTLTGQTLAREVFKHDAAKVFYFPFDWSWAVKRTLNAINPSAVLVMETELWPAFLRECKSRRIPVALVNGRLSPKSFSRYRFIKGFMARVLSSVEVAIMQTDADAERLRALGMESKKTFVCGSLKFDAGATQANDKLTAELRSRFRIAAQTPLILAASTHAPEEQIILDAFTRITSKEPRRIRLMLAPRHPERFRDVATLIQASGHSWSRRTSPGGALDGECDVILLDTIGELQSAYPLATIVFVGGSIAETGGHNILEPAAAGVCVITGAHTVNFKSIVETFVGEEAIIQLPAVRDGEASMKLAEVFIELLENNKLRETLSKRAQNLVEQNRGATDCAIALLMPLLSKAAPSNAGADGKSGT